MGTAEQVGHYTRLQPFVEIMDSTLRDGEQTNGVSFLPHEKLIIARMLLHDLNVDRIEGASARGSEGEKEAVSMICRYAEKIDKLDNVEVLGFVDGGVSVDWIVSCGAKVINLLAKGSLRHCREQLGKSPEEHVEDICREVKYARSKGLIVNLYLEDWSNGMKDSPEYVYQAMDVLCDIGIRRFMLPDTLGIMNPLQCIEYFRKMLKRYPDTHFDFHAHNDYDLAVSNSLAAALSGAKGLHVTVNGLGERCGNAPLSSVQVILKDQFHAKTNINENKLNDISRLVESYSGIAIAPNQPIIGDNVFTQVAGVHADGDNKNGLYQNELMPERFGRRREYALGKNSGKANIAKNLEELGLELTPEQTKKVTQRITELGDKKEIVTQDDLPFIVSDVLKHDAPEDKVKLVSYVVSTAYGLKPGANVKVEINGQQYEAGATGDGQYDAFVKALRFIYRKYLDRTFPLLQNYAVSIPPGGRTDALVQTVITWNDNGKILRTRGLDADQTEAAIKATFKMLNMKLKIAILEGDGIGPEIMKQGVAVLDAIAEKCGHEFEYETAICGAHAIHEVGDPYPEATHEVCMRADAVLFAAVGSLEFDNNPTAKIRPETGLLAMRKKLGLFANVRPVATFDCLLHKSPLKDELLRGADFVVIRELTGGMYFGEKYQDNDKAYDTDIYTRPEIERILKVAFEMAMTRKKHLTVVDKANVLASSRLWRQIAKEMEPQYPEVTTDYMFIDNASMRVLTEPRFFDVIVTENTFGDILTDETSCITGSMGLQPSSSLGEHTPLFEPVHGSWPQAAGQNLANPLAQILSAAMLLEHFGLNKEGALVREAVDASLAANVRTPEIQVEGGAKYGTREVGEWIVNYIKNA